MEPADNKEQGCTLTFITRQSWQKAKEEVDPHAFDDLLQFITIEYAKTVTYR